MLCLALRIVPIGDGVGIGVFKEVPGTRDEGFVEYDLVGYRVPGPGEIDDCSAYLEILDSDQVLAPLPRGMRIEMAAAVDRIDPFWPCFSENHTLTWR